MMQRNPLNDIKTPEPRSRQVNRANLASLEGRYPSTTRLLLRRLAAFWRRLRGDSVGMRPMGGE